MKDISRQDIKTLVRLQEAETQIVILKAVLEKVEREKDKLSVQLKKFENALEKNKEEHLSAAAACRDIDREIKIIDERIIKSNEKLRMVKTNKEYQLFLREVDDNKKRKDALETELLEYLDEQENLKKNVLETEKEYLLLKDKIESEQKEIDKKSKADRKLLKDYQDQQKDIGKNLDASLMTRFAKISKMNGGLAVVPVKNEVCNGCFMNIPPQLYIEVQRENSLINCPQCSRILYYINT